MKLCLLYWAQGWNSWPVSPWQPGCQQVQCGGGCLEWLSISLKARQSVLLYVLGNTRHKSTCVTYIGCVFSHPNATLYDWKYRKGILSIQAIKLTSIYANWTSYIQPLLPTTCVGRSCATVIPYGLVCWYHNMNALGLTYLHCTGEIKR